MYLGSDALALAPLTQRISYLEEGDWVVITKEGAQIFDAVGLSSAFIESYFTGTATTIEGIGLAEVAEETIRRSCRRRP